MTEVYEKFILKKANAIKNKALAANEYHDYSQILVLRKGFSSLSSSNSANSQILTNVQSTISNNVPTNNIYELGNSISDEVVNFTGNSISLNAAGDIMAVGSSGVVRVYQRTGNAYTQLGDDITANEPSNEDGFGYSVSLNADGAVLAVGAPRMSVGGSVYLYRYSNSIWVRIDGDVITGDEEDDLCGESVSLNSLGTYVTVSYTGKSDGIVRVYYDNGGTWQKRGSDISAENIFLQSNIVDINESGNIIVVSLINKLNSHNTINVYKYDTDWEIDFTQTNTGIDMYGVIAAINSIGDIIVYGSGSSGIVNIYKNNNGVWSNIGSLTNDNYDGFGISVAINSTGDIIAVGSSVNGFANVTVTQLFKYAGGTTWNQYGSDIDNNFFLLPMPITNTIALDSSGNIIGIGNPLFGGNKGNVQTYKYMSS